MKNFILLPVFSFFCFLSFGQNVKIDSLMKVLKTAKEDTPKVNTLNEIANEFRSNDPDTAIYFANEALALATKINFKIGIADAYLERGAAIIFIGKYEEALKSINEALKLYDKLLNLVKLSDRFNILKRKANAYNNIGNIFRQQGNYNDALKNHFASLKIKEEIGDKKGLGSAHGNSGNIYFAQGNYPEALKNLFAALKINEEIGDKQFIAMCHISIGSVYRQQKDYREALKNLLFSLKISKEIEDKRMSGVSYGNIGNIYLLNKNYPEALKNFFAALKINEELGDKRQIATSYANIGNIYYMQANYSEALGNNIVALKIREEIIDKEGLTISYINIGDLYIEQRKGKEASTYLYKGLSLAKEIGSLDAIKECYVRLADLYSSQSNYKLSLEHYKLYITYRDSLFNEENTKKIVQTQMQYDFDKKEASTKAANDKKAILAQTEITRQKLNRNYMGGGFSVLLLGSGLFAFLFNQKRKSQFKNQVSQVEMKALRSQMNPHFIFNSLNSIDDYVQHHDIDNSSLYINKFARLMRKILENSRLEQVPLQDDLEVLELYIQMENLRMKNKVAYSVNISPDVNVEQVLIQPLLLQPFVENAFKHAFVGIEQPTLEINVILKGDMIHCEVKDNGKGRGNKQEVVIETKEQRESLGLKVTQERLNIFNKIKKTKAYIAFEDLKDANLNAIGTRVEVAVPVSYAF